MGLCASNNQPSLSPAEAKQRRDETQSSKTVDSQLEKDNANQATFNKLLLLGAGESGKSTLFKQMISIYGTGWKEADRRKFAGVIHSNIVQCIRTLVLQSVNFGIIVGADAEKAVVDELKGDEIIDAAAAAVFKTLWNNEGIKSTYAHRNKFYLLDSCAYFMDRIDEIARVDYMPTEQDVLRARAATSGIVENEFVINGEKFKMFDVGGQRNERKKWIHCFEGVTAVIFVASLSEYDEMLYEDDQTNRMDESLRLFEEISNNKWFKRTAILLFLNKRDIFQEKIKRVPLSKTFPDFESKGGDEYAAATAYIKAKYESKNKQSSRQHIYTHVTCATDTENVRAVFNAVKDIINKQAMDDAGFMS